MERTGNLHTDENNFERNSKPFDFIFAFLTFHTFYWLKSLKYFIKSKIIYKLNDAFPNKKESSTKAWIIDLLKLNYLCFANTAARESKDARRHASASFVSAQRVTGPRFYGRRRSIGGIP